jgi:hypothetical protein
MASDEPLPRILELVISDTSSDGTGPTPSPKHAI